MSYLQWQCEARHPYLCSQRNFIRRKLGKFCVKILDSSISGELGLVSDGSGSGMGTCGEGALAESSGGFPLEVLSGHCTQCRLVELLPLF